MTTQNSGIAGEREGADTGVPSDMPMAICIVCDGSGMKTCAICGEGGRARTVGSPVSGMSCDHCHATQKVECTRCEGTGYAPALRSFLQWHCHAEQKAWIAPFRKAR